MKPLASIIAELRSTRGPNQKEAQIVADFLLEAGSEWECKRHPTAAPSIRKSLRGDGSYDLLCPTCASKN